MHKLEGPDTSIEKKSPNIGKTIRSISRRVYTLLSETAKTSLATTLVTAPVLALSTPEMRALLFSDIPTAFTGILMGSMSFGSGLVLGVKQMKPIDQLMGDTFGHEPVFMRAARYLSRDDIAQLKEHPDAPVTSVVVDTSIYSEFLPQGFRWYYAGDIFPHDIEDIVWDITEGLGMYPKELLESHIDGVMINGNSAIKNKEEDEWLLGKFKELPPSLNAEISEAFARLRNEYDGTTIGGRAYRGKKHFTISEKNAHSEDVDEVVHHEVLHMFLLHGIVSYYSKEWEKKFGKMQEDQTEYASHELFGSSINYGTFDPNEDMATIAEQMFHPDGWKQLQKKVGENNKRGARSGIFEQKIQWIISLYDRETGGLMDAGYFELIQSGKITDFHDAQEYFLSKRKDKRKRTFPPRK